MKNGIVIVSTAGVGKTSLGQKYGNVLDLSPANFSTFENDFENQVNEKYKNIIYTNPEWPQNYFNEILLQRKNYDIVLVAFLIELLNDSKFSVLLKNANIRYRIAIPKLTAVDIIIQRLKDRGNNKSFINIIKKTYPSIIAEFSKEKYNSIIIHDNEYLEDALIREKLLVPRN